MTAEHEDVTAAASVTARTGATGPAAADHLDLGRRTARGAGQVFGGQLAKIIIQTASVVVLARLLSPVDYGLIAVVLSVVGIGELVRDFGLSAAAVQAESLSPAQRNTLWWFNTAIGGTLAVLLIIAAPLVADIFGDPRLTAISRWLALTFVINGMTAQYRAHLNRHLRFGALVISDFSALLAGILGGILLAVLGAGYWSLVAQQLIQCVVALAIMVGFSRWVPGWPRRGADVKALTRFGVGVTGSALVTYFSGNVDTYAISLTLGIGPLGLYNRNYQLVMRPLGQLRGPSTSVALPALSKLRNDTDRAGRFLMRGQLAMCYPIILGLALAAGAATPVIGLVLGDAWANTGPIFATLCMAGAFQTVSFVGYWVYLSRGLTSKLFRFALFNLAIKIGCVAVGVQFGLLGVAIGMAVAPAIESAVTLWWLGRLTPLPTAGLVRGALRVLFCGTVVGLAARAGVLLMSDRANLLQLLTAIGTAVIAVGFLLLVPRLRVDARDLLRSARAVVQR